MPRPPRWSWQQWEEATIMLLGRDGDQCALCAQPLRGDADRHHRMRRKEGGDRLENLVLAHHRCHMAIHDRPEESRRRGLIVPTWGDLLVWPLHVKGIRWVRLTAEGTRVSLTPQEVDSWLALMETE
jgi:5-methylcytosine-specific restriction endonuclease McrA